MQVAAREPAQRHRDEQSGERRVFDPLPVIVMPCASSSTAAATARSPGVAATSPEVSTSASRRQYDAWPGSISLGRVLRGRQGQPLDHDRPSPLGGPPDADGGRAGAARKRMPARLGLPHGINVVISRRNQRRSRCSRDGGRSVRASARAARQMRMVGGGVGSTVVPPKTHQQCPALEP